MVTGLNKSVLLWLFVAGTVLFQQISGQSVHDSGAVLIFNKQYRDAIWYYDGPVRKDSASVYVHRNYQDACKHYSDSTKELAGRFYKTLVQADTDNTLYNYLYGRCLPCREGMQYFNHALRLSSCDQWALNAVGACYFEAGDYLNAKEKFLKAIKCNPDFGEAYQNAAQVYLATKQPRRALNVFRKLITRNRKNPEAFEWLGDIYRELEKFPYARLAYQKSVYLGRKPPSIFFKLGYVCFKENNYLKAMENYKKSIDYGNRNYEVYFNLGTVYELLQMPQEALESYQRAFEKNAQYKILYSMGNCAVQLGLYSKAIESYNGFLEKEPLHTEALVGLANAYQMKKQYSKAIAIYKKIITCDSVYAKAYYNLGSIYAYYLKEYDNMEKYWGKYIELFPRQKDSEFLLKEMAKIKAN